MIYCIYFLAFLPCALPFGVTMAKIDDDVRKYNDLVSKTVDLSQAHVTDDGLLTCESLPDSNLRL